MLRQSRCRRTGGARVSASFLERETHSGGMLRVDWGRHAFRHDLAFGGIGNSGMGTYHGEEGFRELSRAKAIFRRHRFLPAELL